jgi:hypothetical protein
MAARARTSSDLIANLILVFLSDVFCAEALLQMALRFAASWEGLGRSRIFLPEATNRNAALKVTARSGGSVTPKSTSC